LQQQVPTAVGVRQDFSFSFPLASGTPVRRESSETSTAISEKSSIENMSARVDGKQPAEHRDDLGKLFQQRTPDAPGATLKSPVLNTSQPQVLPHISTFIGDNSAKQAAPAPVSRPSATRQPDPLPTNPPTNASVSLDEILARRGSDVGKLADQLPQLLRQLESLHDEVKNRRVQMMLMNNEALSLIGATAHVKARSARVEQMLQDMRAAAGSAIPTNPEE
jgi:hypothetical protein